MANEETEGGEGVEAAAPEPCTECGEDGHAAAECIEAHRHEDLDERFDDSDLEPHDLDGVRW